MSSSSTSHDCLPNAQVIEKTVTAAMDAPIPPGCTKKVWLCDDGEWPAAWQHIACTASAMSVLAYSAG